MSESVFPNDYDDDSTLIPVSDNITENGEEVINSIRSAVFNLETEMGLTGKGSLGSIAERLAVSIDDDGTIKPASLLSIGLVALPITNDQISPTAEIEESKLSLTYPTISLYNYYLTLQNAIDVLNGFLSLTGIKLQPHLDGTSDRHLLSHIDIDSDATLLKIIPQGDQAPGTSVGNRDTTDLKTLAKDISDDLVVHQKSDSSSGVSAASGGTVPPENYAHNASGIFVNTDNFTSIPQANNDVQKLADFIDNSSLLLIGSRIQNLYDNGISRTSRSTLLDNDGYSSAIVSETPVIAYFLNQPPGPQATSPIDDFANGDDVILFQPTAGQLSTFNFDNQFAQVRPGDLITINYGTGLAFQFVIEATKSIINGSNRTYAVRINGRNPFTTSAGYARIDRSFFNRNKYHALANSRVPNSVGELETLIVANPRAAVALGNGFNPSQIDASHYNLYLTLLQNGDTSSIFTLPAIDITGNQGKTPEKYTLQSIIDSTNAAFRSPGFNYRFMAFEFEGNFGIAMTDHYNGSSFTIISGVVDSYGEYGASSNAAFQKNVVDNYNGIDPLGLGFSGSNLASPPPAVAYGNAAISSKAPTLIFAPLKRNFFYVDGVERDTVYSDPTNLTENRDDFGDGYVAATILPSPASQILANRVENTYQITEDISQSGLKAGKTLVVQPAFASTDPRFNLRDYGRYTIKSITYFNCGEEDGYANVTVYDGVHGAGTSPAATSTNIPVHIYFSDDSVAFNKQNVADDAVIGSFKRFFETYIADNGKTFTHERARFLNSGTAANFDFYDVSPKLKGFSNGQYKELRLNISSYEAETGLYDGYLGRWDSANSIFSNFGPIAFGKRGEITRFYDENSIDYIDLLLDRSNSVANFSNETLDIQLFPTLELDGELLLLSTCQLNDTTKKITNLVDKREFGNISEEHLSSSALNYIAAVPKATQENGVISGFDEPDISSNTITINGGSALINGKIILVNKSVISIPILREFLYPSFTTGINTINWFICVNQYKQLELIANTDFDVSLSGTYGSLDHDRIFYVKNPNVPSPTYYPVRSGYISKIISDFKDLIPIYLATMTVTPSGSNYVLSSLTINDIRSFI